jgi:hypothetical protein
VLGEPLPLVARAGDQLTGKLGQLPARTPAAP